MNPQLMIITDIHLSDDNTDQIKDVMLQAFNTAVSKGLKVIYLAGDFVNARKSQTEKVLYTLKTILNLANEMGLVIRAIPGNHDKSDYESERSYLDVYDEYPALELVTSYQSFKEGDLTIHMIPFFDERTTYQQHFDKVQYNKNDILITHVAVNGVVNNDGSKMSDVLPCSLFDKFDKVFIGHYHDMQQIGDNIFYIGAIIQKNYGEDINKGFTLVNADGSHYQVQSKFKQYITIKIDLDDDNTDLTKLKSTYENHPDDIRFKFTGSEAKVKALDRMQFENLGIDVKCSYKDVEIQTTLEQAQAFEGFDKSKIQDEWKEFTDSNEDIDYEVGLTILKQALK